MNWDSIAGTAAGVATIVVAIVLTVQRAVKRWGAAEMQPEHQPTKIITTDSIALGALAVSIDTLNKTALEIAEILRNELHDREVRAKIRMEDLVKEQDEERRSSRPPRRT